VDKHESSYAPGSWTEALVPDGEGGEESISNDRDYSIVLQMPEELKKRLVRIPRGAKWSFVKHLMDNTMGEHQWYATFLGELWQDGSIAPDPGQIVFIHLTYKAERSVEEIIREPLVKQYWDELSKSVKEEEEWRQNYFKNQWKKDSGISSFSLIMSRRWEASLDLWKKTTFRSNSYYPQRILKSCR
jgi:hypothetical protein